MYQELQNIFFSRIFCEKGGNTILTFLQLRKSYSRSNGMCHRGSIEFSFIISFLQSFVYCCWKDILEYQIYLYKERCDKLSGTFESGKYMRVLLFVQILKIYLSELKNESTFIFPTHQMYLCGLKNVFAQSMMWWAFGIFVSSKWEYFFRGHFLLACKSFILWYMYAHYWFSQVFSIPFVFVFVCLFYLYLCFFVFVFEPASNLFSDTCPHSIF